MILKIQSLFSRSYFVIIDFYYYFKIYEIHKQYKVGILRKQNNLKMLFENIIKTLRLCAIIKMPVNQSISFIEHTNLVKLSVSYIREQALFFDITVIEFLDTDIISK